MKSHCAYYCYFSPIDMLLDHEVISSPPLQLHCYDLSGATPTDRTELLKSEHKTSAYSLACLDNPQYFCYQSASLKILHYAQLGKYIQGSLTDSEHISDISQCLL